MDINEKKYKVLGIDPILTPYVLNIARAIKYVAILHKEKYIRTIRENNHQICLENKCIIHKRKVRKHPFSTFRDIWSKCKLEYAIYNTRVFGESISRHALGSEPGC